MLVIIMGPAQRHGGRTVHIWKAWGQRRRWGRLDWSLAEKGGVKEPGQMMSLVPCSWEAEIHRSWLPGQPRFFVPDTDKHTQTYMHTPRQHTHTYTYHKGGKARGEFVLSNVPFRKFKLLKSSKVSLKQIEHKPWPGNQQVITCRSHVVTSHMVVRWCGPRIHFWTWLLGLFTPMCSPLVTMGTVVPKGLTRCLTQSENIHHGCDRSGRKWLDT